ncbi:MULTISPECIES: VOC family protein [Haloferax]|uniref:VOC family protein n=1 Tax=Haloferax marinum TaxID=2666143 RepID=A0A6A8GA76_9EURY|nr:MULTISPECIES: VOC family protein [Haloferax]KAB1198101.1 VOC family protein [Haloferax sp. CBA1150]MRW97173.1 VOC family protein [Haloferax marinum]
MDARAIDHVNLRIPEDGVETAVAFYGDALGFDIENRDLFEAGDKPFISVRLTPVSIVHLQPTAKFHPPDETAFDHVAIEFDHTIDEIRASLDAAGVEVDRQLDPLGATGVAPAVYVTDPFGYTLELKALPTESTE